MTRSPTWPSNSGRIRKVTVVVGTPSEHVATTALKLNSPGVGTVVVVVELLLVVVLRGRR